MLDYIIALGQKEVVENESRLFVKVRPSAAANGVNGFKEGELQLTIAAPPLQGRANRELVVFLAKKLGLRRDAVSIVSGHTSRNKLIYILGLGREEALRRLLEE